MADKLFEKPLVDRVDENASRAAIFRALKAEYPILDEYDKLARERMKASRYQAEKLDKSMLVKAKLIAQNETLCQTLKKHVPEFIPHLKQKIAKNKLLEIE